jgi:succinate dehydrogenase / fumarate reductase membrane anchor subunit
MNYFKIINPRVFFQKPGNGTDKHIRMIITSVILAIVAPIFIFTFGKVLGSSYEDANIFLSKPTNAIIVVLTVCIGLLHFRYGVQTLIEDYVRGSTKKILLTIANIICYSAIAINLISIIRIYF